MDFASVMAGLKMPNGSKIKLSKLSIPHFVLGTSLFIVLICIHFVLNPTIFLTIVRLVFYLNLTSSFFDGNSCVVYFRISRLFKANLSRLNPFDFRSCITS